MAVATKAAPKQAPAAPAPTTETKEEPTVVADIRLGKMLKDYTKQESETQSYWLKIVEYVSKNNVTRATLIATLQEYRKVQKSTASVEATYIMKGAAPENANLLQQALDGDITTREFRKATMGATKVNEETGEVEIDYSKRIDAKLKGVAGYAIKNVEITVKEFRQMAGDAFEKAEKSAEKAAAKGEASGEGDEGEEGEEGELDE
jgi:hypothetical protein